MFLNVEIKWPQTIHHACAHANSNLNKMFIEKTLPMVYRAILPQTDRIPPLVLGNPSYLLKMLIMGGYF